MAYRTRIWLLWLIPSLLTLIALVGIGWHIYLAVPDPEARDLILLWLALAAFAIIGALTAIWALLDWHCFIPLGALARGARIIGVVGAARIEVVELEPALPGVDPRRRR